MSVNELIRSLTSVQTACNDLPLLHGCFERWADRTPERPAIRCCDEQLTYGELEARANRLAGLLISNGVKPGNLVGIYLDRSVNLMVAILAVLKSGAGYVPLQPGLPADRLRHIVEDADLVTVITQKSQEQRITSVFRGSNIVLEQEQTRLGGFPETRPGADATGVIPTNICYVIYTSGSTGKPKGVMIEHRNAVTFVTAAQQVYGVTADDRVYQGFSVAFDAAVEELWSAWSNGAELVVAPDCVIRSPNEVARYINQYAVTLYSTVPSFLSMMEDDLPSVRLMIVGGEPCAPELVSRWATNFRRFLNTYGPTEATVVTTVAECRPGEKVTIGKALPGYYTVVLDEHLNPTPVGEIGELFIGGPGVARGYVNLPGLTAERFVKNPFSSSDRQAPVLYRSMDLVRSDENGNLEFHGRADSQIKIRGFRIELSEIESVLLEYKQIKAVAVTKVTIDGIPELAAFVVKDGIQEIDRLHLAETLPDRLPEYMVPGFVDEIEDIPLTNSGKVDRNALPEPKTRLRDFDRPIIEPVNETETALKNIWEAATGLSPISVMDDFFMDLGGHSMLAARVISQTRQERAGKAVSVHDLYRLKTIRALAAHMDSQKPTLGSSDSAAGRSAVPEMNHAPTATKHFVVLLQALSIYLLLGILAAPLVASAYFFMPVYHGTATYASAMAIAVPVSFLVWPSLIVLSISAKWLLIGRYREGRYPVWGRYYLRWWIVARLQTITMINVLAGSPLMNLYLRAMGAKIGSGCIIDTSIFSAFDLVSVGKNSSLGAESHLTACRVENGELVIGAIRIGEECTVGVQCVLGARTAMDNGAILHDMSFLPDGARIEAGKAKSGSPAISVRARPIADPEQPATPKHRTLLGLAQLTIIYGFAYLALAAQIPGLALVYFAYTAWGVTGVLLGAYVAAPLGLVVLALLLVITKRLIIGAIKPGIYKVDSRSYLRIWSSDFLVNILQTYFMAVYATLYFPPLMRLLGAKIGHRSEVSTISHFIPEMLVAGDEVFLADGCIVGGKRIANGLVEVNANRIGKRSFIGNSALVPPGKHIARDCLVGVLSTPPRGTRSVPRNSRWLGLSPFRLPQTENVACFDDNQTFRPGARLIAARLGTDALRILLPVWMFVLEAELFLAYIVWGYAHLNAWQFLTITPIAMAAAISVSLLAVVGLKWMIMGRFKPSVHPLWCRFVWFNEVINGVYENVAAPVLGLLTGTPFISVYMRMLGCKIGRWVFLDTTLFSEFDLVDIGDHAALNLGATVQNHLFEDRIMKSSTLRIGSGCSVGNMAVVLYDSSMQDGSSLHPLSLLMKGESLPSGTEWIGVPCEPVRKPTVRQTRQRRKPKRSRDPMQSRSRKLQGARRAAAGSRN